MTNTDFKALEQPVTWTEGYDGHTHYADVIRALTPAFVILAAISALMLAIL